MRNFIIILSFLFLISACKSALETETHDRAIRSDINDKIDHATKAKLNKELDDIFLNNHDIF